MTDFLVIRTEGTIPAEVQRAAFEATGGVIRAWAVLNPSDELRMNIDLLHDGAPQGPDRRRHSVLSRLYKDPLDA